MQIHVVQGGDTLWQLSQQYGVSTQQIVAANGLENPNQLLIGQAVIIPTSYYTYTVQPGDNIFTIAANFGTTALAIMQANRLTNPGAVYPGQQLTIPVVVHTVRSGDTLWSLAERYGTTAQAIMQANGIMNASAIYPGQMLRMPEQPKRTIDVNAFTTEFGQKGAQDVRDVASHLTYVSPFAYRMKADGTLEGVDDSALIRVALASNVLPMMAITNFSATEAGTGLAHTILSSVELQEKLLSNILGIMKEKGYRGLNIDFENVSPEDRVHYNEFLQRAVDRLHPEGYFVSSDLAPKTSSEQTGLLYEAHDYEAHGRILDFVVLMTYEWGYRKGPPQAISPIDQIRKVLDYAVTVIPRDKILMGFQVYARDWLLPHVQGQEAETFDMQEAIRRAVEHQVQIQYNETAASPFFRYTDNQGRRHEVWFEDARSAQAKFDLVKEYDLRGLSYWVLGYPFPQNWYLLEANFNVRKYSTASASGGS
ncbi:LysM peptidoglycan-binding domain-containing protein [Paenibacillus thalictri]|uniref:LysM peptidoglycan-binding domain-containing protein n=1 Tax=Paenibacillus thalictri TaxID=2527873 RepID=A0A4Q9DP50_9BACL|nr:LysM peptidoglycan-binding domain-containing protein [Paenibacillus thalictri]TBL77876.1 LysM peptidoglycan-binding domain-containing protein [Paenibacillus thalictri]